MNRAIITITLTALLFATICSAEAADVRAFHNINQLPLKHIFGLPSLDNNPLTKRGQWRFGVISNISNTYNYSIKADDETLNDVETFRGSLNVSYGLRDNWQLSLAIPYISHDGGFLDDFIYDWHDFFNMPQNGRTKEESDQLQISYYANSGTSFELTDSEKGLGDIRINAAYSRPWRKRALIFSGEIKLPTGDYDKLTGSGGFDLSLGLTINDPLSLQKYRITLYGGLAGIFLGDSDGELAEIQNNFALAGR
ncbi:MAG: DUF3187 family protein, partial [Desulfobulbales bacterium]|nr:DUF3187 family protein [Desulfobulbales bacterium]